MTDRPELPCSETSAMFGQQATSNSNVILAVWSAVWATVATRAIRGYYLGKEVLVKWTTPFQHARPYFKRITC